MKAKHAPCGCGCGELADECMSGGHPLAAFTISPTQRALIGLGDEAFRQNWRRRVERAESAVAKFERATVVCDQCGEILGDVAGSAFMEGRIYIAPELVLTHECAGGRAQMGSFTDASDARRPYASDNDQSGETGA